MNKYLARLKAQSTEMPLGGEHSKSSKFNFDDFESTHTRHVSPETGIPHLRYGHDGFSRIRLPHPALLPRKAKP